MAALNGARNTPRRDGDVFGIPVKAATTIFQGSLVVVDAGYSAPGRTAVGLIAAGRAEETVTAVATGDAVAQVRAGTYKFSNAAADLVTQADFGADCYIVDDQTVAKTNGTNTRSRAGKVVAVEPDGVWVQIGIGR